MEIDGQVQRWASRMNCWIVAHVGFEMMFVYLLLGSRFQVDPKSTTTFQITSKVVAQSS